MPTKLQNVKKLAAACTLALSLATLGGCAMDRGDAVPTSAVLRAEGTGDLVSYTPTSSGTGYVYDSTDNKLVWSGTVRPDQMITVDAKRNAILVDNRPVQEKGIHSDHHYRIFVDAVVHS